MVCISEFHKFIFDVLKPNKNDFMEFFRKNIGVGHIKCEIIYDFVNRSSDFSLFLNTPIKGLGKVTKQKVWNFNLVSNNKIEKKIDFLDILHGAFKLNNELTLKEIYNYVSNTVGGSHINVNTLKPYTLKNGVELDKFKAKQRQEGFIRSFLEEHSSDSRQHWVKGNKLYRNGVAPNLFSNDSLRQRNQLVHWKIESDETKLILKNSGVKKSGLWKKIKSTSHPTDEDFQIIENELKCRPKGFSRQANTGPKEKVILTRTYKTIKII